MPEPQKTFTPYGIVPQGMYRQENPLRAKEEEAKGIMFSQLDNPNYSEERREQLRNFINRSYVQPDVFDRNPGLLLSAFNPYTIIERNGLSEYGTSTDDEGFEPQRNPFVMVEKDKSDVINLPLNLLKDKKAPKDTLAHEITHTRQTPQDEYDVVKEFGGEKAWRKFVDNLYEQVPGGERKRERHPYLVRMLGEPSNFLTGEGGDPMNYIGYAGYGMPTTYSPMELFADFQAMKQQFSADDGRDITQTQEFKNAVFKGNKRAEKAFYKYMKQIENR